LGPTRAKQPLTMTSAFLIYSCFCFSMFFLIPETKGLSLEKMDDLFGVTELIKNMEADREHHGAATEINLDGKEAVREERKEVITPTQTRTQ
jgi:hypothetical protein